MFTLPSREGSFQVIKAIEPFQKQFVFIKIVNPVLTLETAFLFQAPIDASFT